MRKFSIVSFRDFLLKGAVLLPVLAASAIGYGQNFQTTQPVSFLPQAPNTATLGKFGDYPVGMYTGVPQISIPIYVIKTSTFEIPITIDYHASGIKVAEYPSWVGAGWALNTGGSVRRQLVGNPDELGGFLSGHPIKSSDIDLHTPGPGSEADYDYLHMLDKRVYDFGADIFAFSFPGGESGKFFFDRDNSNKPVMMPYSPVKVTAFTGDTSQPAFKMYDAKGNYYAFGKNAVELGTMGGVMGGSINLVSAWMLEKMVSPSKLDEVTFTYYSQAEFGPFERNDITVVTDGVNELTGWCIPADMCEVSGGMTSICEDGLPNPGYTNNMSAEYTRNETVAANNKEIFFANGKVVFELESGARQDFNYTANNNKALGKIKVYEKRNSSYVLIKTITLVHSYFIDGVDTKTKRLRLDSLRMEDSQGVVIGKYGFNYNTTINLPAGDPNSAVNASVAKDYWGYYNGRTNNWLTPQLNIEYAPTITPPSSTTTVTIGSSNPVGREPDADYMQAAILKRISYPTGGHTDFEYEPNKYLDESSNPKLAGGLRIKSIKSYDGITSTPLIKTYKYGQSESGYGRANFHRPYLFFNDEVTGETYYYDMTCVVGAPKTGIHNKVSTTRVRTYTSNPTLGMSNTDGNPVSYPYVTEYIGEGTNVLGKTEYVYRDGGDDAVSVGPNYTPSVAITRFFDRGQLLSKTIYKKNSSGLFKKVEEETNTYNTSTFANTGKFGGLLVKRNFQRSGLIDMGGFAYPMNVRTGTDWSYVNIQYITDDNYLTASTKKTYNADNEADFLSVTTTYAYGSDRHQQPVSVTTTNSKGDTWVDEVRRPADYIVSGSVTNNAVLDAMLAKNMQVYPVEEWRRKSTSVIAGGVALYKELSNGLIVPDKQKRLKIRTAVTDYQPASIVSTALQTDSRFETILNFVSYDLKGNVLELQKENDVKEVLLWGYNGQYPVARVLDANYSTVSGYVTQSILDNPSSDLTLRQHLEGLRTSLSGKQIVTFTYSPVVGLTSQSDIRGRMAYYFYDNFGRLSFIRDHDNKVIKRICYNYYGQTEDCGCASTTANWQNTATAVRCKTSGIYNTGEQEQEQRDMNPCSGTYGQLQWVVIGTNTTACPLPCQLSCIGEDKKCVNNICETGTKVYTQCSYNWSTGMYDNTYHYEFSDSSWSIDYYESTVWAPCLE